MTNRFEYNFTLESQFQEIKERMQELEQDNSMLKQSLQQLIKVNTQLTETIEELTNNNNMILNNDVIEAKFQMLINENQSLRERLENSVQNKKSNKQSQIHDGDQTENLVNVLEQLMQSFKNIEAKYQKQINDLVQNINRNSLNYQQKMDKFQQQLRGYINTVEVMSSQLKRKDEILQLIQNKFKQLQNKAHPDNLTKTQKHIKNNDKNLESKIEKVNKDLQQKNRVIKSYQELVFSIRGKIMQKI